MPTGKNYSVPDSEIGVGPKGAVKFADTFINVSNRRMQQLVQAMVDSGRTTWFGADVTQSVDYATGIMHPQIHLTNQGFNLTPRRKISASKADRPAETRVHPIGPRHGIYRI